MEHAGLWVVLPWAWVLGLGVLQYNQSFVSEADGMSACTVTRTQHTYAMQSGAALHSTQLSAFILYACQATCCPAMHDAKQLHNTVRWHRGLMVTQCPSRT